MPSRAGSQRMLAIVVLAGAALVASASAAGSFRGSNGDIAFVSDTQDVIAAPCTSSPTQECSVNPPLIGRRYLVRVGADGTVHRVLLVPIEFGEFRGSPDGARIAYGVGQGIFVVNLAGHHRRRITRTGGKPAWAPDGRRLAFEDEHSLWVVGADRRGRRRLTTGARDSNPEWSPDGRTITFIRRVRLSRRSPCFESSALYGVPAGGGRPHRLFRPAFNCGWVESFDWAPNGNRLVLTLGEGVKEDQPADPRARDLVGMSLLRANGTGLRRIQEEGSNPVWSPDGRSIAFFGSQCRAPQDIGQVLCRVRPDGRGLRRVTAVREDIGAQFAPDWLVRRP